MLALKKERLKRFIDKNNLKSMEDIRKLLTQLEKETMVTSTKVRVPEFMNILDGSKDSFVSLLVRNGIGESFTDKYYPISLFPDAYSEAQWPSKKFYRVHKTLYILLKFGIVEILLLSSFIIWLLSRAYHEPSVNKVFLYIVLVFGVLFMLGYSLKLAVFFGTTMGILASRRVRLPTDRRR
jgi:hypothetical protein